MYYCNKCHKSVNSKKDLYKGLCEKCYKQYLLKKIENLEISDFSKKNKSALSLITLLKKIFLNK